MGRKRKFSDDELIKILMENARMPYVEIAKMFGVSETTIRKRIAKLEEDKVILKYTIEVDPRKLGYRIVAIVGVDTEPEAYISVISELKAMQEIKKLYTSSGDHMIMFEAWLPDSDSFSDFIRKVESIKGVKKVCPAIILERIK